MLLCVRAVLARHDDSRRLERMGECRFMARTRHQNRGIHAKSCRRKSEPSGDLYCSKSSDLNWQQRITGRRCCVVANKICRVEAEVLRFERVVHGSRLRSLAKDVNRQEMGMERARGIPLIVYSMYVCTSIFRHKDC